MSTFQASHIETDVQKAIVKKIQALNRLNLSDNKETNFFSTAKTLEPADDLNPLEYHLVRNTFCRLSVDIPVKGEEKNKVLFFSSYITPGSERYGKKTQANRHITFNKNPFTKDKKFIWRGEAGITGVQVSQKSFFVKQLTINWSCPDPNDFEEIIKPAFLKHGRFMVLEFGWGISSKGETFPEITTGNMSDYMTNLRERNAKTVESYQAECGIVTSYGYDVDDQGGYSGTITITSRGDNVLGTTIQNTDKDETVTRFTPISSEKVKTKAENITSTFKEVVESLTEYVNTYTGGKVKIGAGSESELNATIFYTKFKNGAQTIASDNKENFRGTYVSWGWFEDHILNSFFKIEVSTRVGKQPFQEFRSIHGATVEEMSGVDVEFDDSTLDEFVIFGDDVSNRCNNVVGLYSLGLNSVILPGQNTPALVKELLRQETIKQRGAAARTKSGFFGLFKDDDTKANDKIVDELETQEKTLNKVLNSFKIIDDNFKPFGKPEQMYGNIRNVVFNTEYLKSHFEGINTIQEGISSLWSDVSAKYGGFFKFGLHQDENNNGRIAVVDFNYQNDLEKRTELISDRETLNFQKYIEGRASIHGEKMWQFGLFSKDSIIKDFSLSLQLTKEAATLAMYGTGVDGRFINQSSLPDLGIERFAALSNSEIYKKIHPSGSTTLAQERNRTNEIVINDFTAPVDGVDDTLGLTNDEEYNKNGLVESLLTEGGLDFKVIEAVSTRIESTKSKQKTYHFIKDANLNIGYDENGEMGEDTKRKMLSRINYSNIDGEMSNFQLNKTIIPIELTMTIDGVGGLRPGNLFRVDYLPKIYRDYTYFQIFTIGHTINTSGWSTSIGAKMKLDFPKMIKDGLVGLTSGDNKISRFDSDSTTIIQDHKKTRISEQDTPTNFDSELQLLQVRAVTGEITDEERVRLSELQGLVAVQQDFDNTYGAVNTTPEAPRPVIPPIDDPYDEELENDFVIEETTLDDFEPWEAPAPFVPAEDGNTEVEIFSGDVNVYTENNTTKVKQEKVKVKVKKKEPNTTRTYTDEELAIPTTIEEIKQKFGSTLSFRQDSGEYFINNKKVSQFEYMVVERVYKDYFNEFVGYTAL